MELPCCSWCGETLGGLYLFSCGELACALHVLAPWCSTHPESILITSIADDSEVAHLQRMEQIKPESGLADQLCSRIKALEVSSLFWKCACGYVYNLQIKNTCGCCKAPK